MSKTQRTILFFLPLHMVTLFFCYFLTRYWFIGLALQLALTGLMMRRLLAGGSRAAVVAKSSQPALFIAFASLYSMLLVQIFGTSITWFTIMTVVIVLGYGLLCQAVLRAEMSVVSSSVIALVLIALTSGFIILAQAYWRLPNVAALPIVWLTGVTIGLWWLLEITHDNKGILPLAAVWALLSCELAWMYSHWIVLYQLPGVSLVVAQPAVLITTLAYCLGGVFYHQKRKRLTLSVGIEYLVVFVAVCTLVLIFTKWATAL